MGAGPCSALLGVGGVALSCTAGGRMRAWPCSALLGVGSGVLSCTAGVGWGWALSCTAGGSLFCTAGALNAKDLQKTQ